MAKISSFKYTLEVFDFLSKFCILCILHTQLSSNKLILYVNSCLGIHSEKACEFSFFFLFTIQLKCNRLKHVHESCAITPNWLYLSIPSSVIIPLLIDALLMLHLLYCERMSKKRFYIRTEYIFMNKMQN